MIKRAFIFIFIIFLVYLLLPLITEYEPATELNRLSKKYVKDGPAELGGANIVTSIIVTYRGLDTLGEIAVLFIATAGIGFLFRRKQKNRIIQRRDSSEILKTGASFLLPLIFLFGAYIFIHGHLTPGGGFQGGVVIASGILLLMLSDISIKFNHTILHLIESLSGTFYILIGILGIFFAAGFLDNRFLPLGDFGKLFSAGAIPIIYSLIGLKVGSELVGILENMQGSEE